MLVDANGGRVALEGHGPGGAAEAAFSADGTTVFTGGSDHRVLRWDTRTGQAAWAPGGLPSPALSVAFLPGGHQLVTAGADGVRVWSTVDLALRSFTPGAALWVRPIGPNGLAIVDGTLPAFPPGPGAGLPWAFLRTPDQVRVASGPDGAANGLELRAHLAGLAAAGTLDLPPQRLAMDAAGTFGFPAEGCVLVLGDEQTSLCDPASAPLSDVDFSRSGRWAVASGAGGLVVWDRDIGAVATRFPQGVDAPQVAISDDGARLGWADDTGIWALDVASGRSWPCRAFEGPVDDLALSDDGRFLAAAAADDTLTLWTLPQP